jgi:NlpC/P60 family putative phage cell wall peptidase
MTTREQVIIEARRWIGTPWKHQQFMRGVGCDCIGLIGGVALALGLPGAEEWRDTPAFHNYGRRPDPELLLRGCDLLMQRIELGAARIGDVLVMRFTEHPQHFAFISDGDPPRIIHAYAQARKVTEQRLDATWEARILRAYRLRGAA